MPVPLPASSTCAQQGVGRLCQEGAGELAGAVSRKQHLCTAGERSGSKAVLAAAGREAGFILSPERHQA